MENQNLENKEVETPKVATTKTETPSKKPRRTKKEIEAQETKSGIKIIDNDIVYIKKGQEVTADEMRAIAEIINNKS